MHVYGIKNCNTVKKALDWLDENNVEYAFHDFKKEGASPAKLRQWASAAGWESLLNKKGTTWRKLAPEEQTSVVDQQSAIELLQRHTSAIKRPVIESPNGIILGFDEAEYRTKLK